MLPSLIDLAGGHSSFIPKDEIQEHKSKIGRPGLGPFCQRGMNKFTRRFQVLPRSPKEGSDPAHCGLSGLFLPLQPLPPSGIYSALLPESLKSPSLCPKTRLVGKHRGLGSVFPFQIQKPWLPGQRLHFLWIPSLPTSQVCVEKSWATARIPGLHPGESFCSPGRVPVGSTCPVCPTAGDRQLGPVLQA